MKIREVLLCSGISILVLVLGVWAISQINLFSLQDGDKEFVSYQIKNIEGSAEEIHEQLNALNNRLSSLENLNKLLVEFNRHLNSAETVAQDIRESAREYHKEYQGVGATLIKELKNLNQNLIQIHEDQVELLDTIKKLEKRLSPFLGSDD